MEQKNITSKLDAAFYDLLYFIKTADKEDIKYSEKLREALFNVEYAVLILMKKHKQTL